MLHNDVGAKTKKYIQKSIPLHSHSIIPELGVCFVLNETPYILLHVYSVGFLAYVC